MKRYYYAGATRVAMRMGSTLRWLLGDHLGSTNRMANSDGSPYRMVLYKGWGETRYVDGTLPTKYKYTGQRQESGLGGPEGLYYYGARWYDPTLSRFAHADTIIPEQSQGVQAWDRYAYVNNNPVLYNDPSGHCLILCTAAISAVIGFTANYALQTINNMQSGMSFGQAASWSNINHQDLAVATVGGFVGGLTLGITTAAVGAIGLTGGLATATSGIVGGAVSNVTAGQTEAVTNAVIDQVTANTTLEVTPEGQHVVNFSPNLNQLASDASNHGFGNPNTIIHDAFVGGVVGGLSVGVQGAIADIGTPSALFIGSQPASWIRPASQGVDWTAQTFIEYDKENNR